MNIADRIQQLRKVKGISQEELADRAGVSRQAVSKWESGQSTPDIEKVILLCDYFEVTTDYLLRGVGQDRQAERSRPNAGLFALAGTALNFSGIVASVCHWIECQNSVSAAIGLIFMAAGCMLYGMGMMVGEESSKKKARRFFWLANLWMLVLIPYSCMAATFINILFFKNLSFRLVPYPVLKYSCGLGSYALQWLLYLVICVAGEILVWKKCYVSD